ncbi:hypothetical protein AYI68_g7192 [Smittium mucronatum]|uniref:Uncharacterized protein n=1 Tax=Smittium mucronatum TaxID=133383 RepID=A0A1R0GPC5_9FUNG|nr:hypothetical protein AYI68_g7192 [Smittium mucronatum]
MYKSAICQLAPNPQAISGNDFIRRLIIALQETSKTSFIRPSMDISPIIEYFRELGDNEKLNIKSLTSKTCWSLSVCGFMRASDINRIENAQTTTFDRTLKLVIVAPKEKRKGRPIIRPC